MNYFTPFLFLPKPLKIIIMKTAFYATLLVMAIIATISCSKKENDTTTPTIAPNTSVFKPVITLNGGDDTISFSLYNYYADPGYTAKDQNDSNITTDVVVSGTVNRQSAGEYVLKYNVKDKSGIAADEKTRKITVDAGIYIADVTGVRYSANGWYGNTNSNDSYIDTLFVTGVNKFRFSRLANWRNARIEVGITGVNIAGSDTTLNTGTNNTPKTYKIIAAQMNTATTNVGVFELKGSVTSTSGTIITDEFYYVFTIY